MSRLFVQVLLSLGLVGLALLVMPEPAGPLGRIQQELRAAVSEFDIKAKAGEARQWVTDRGWLVWSQAVPVGGGNLLPVQGAVISEFGWGDGGFHEGVDLGVPVGSPVVALNAGTVVRVGHDKDLGQVVEIDHGDILARYGQVEQVGVKAGERVKRGQHLAVVARPVGRERSLGGHLHLEIRPLATQNGVDPVYHLPRGGRKI